MYVCMCVCVSVCVCDAIPFLLLPGEARKLHGIHGEIIPRQNNALLSKLLQVFLLLISISSVYLAKLYLRCIEFQPFSELNQLYSSRNQVKVGLGFNLEDVLRLLC